MTTDTRPRILCVDDERAVLDGFKLHLGRRFDVRVASSGPEALATIVSDGPFAVIITDMRMPQMDGVELLTAAQQFVTDTSLIMLTGNLDVITATEAINRGRVFRFLNKPCPMPAIVDAVTQGVERFDLLRENRELLNSTFVGAVRVLTDVLELSQPSIFARANFVAELAHRLFSLLGIPERWEYKLAMRLSRIGAVVLSASDGDAPSDSSAAKVGAREAEIGGKLLGNIPRLSLVAQIVAASGNPTGFTYESTEANDEIVQTGATVIYIAWLMDGFLLCGMAPHAVARCVADSLSAASPKLLTAVMNLATEVAASRKLASVCVRLSELVEGMVTAEAIPAESGLYLAAGINLSLPMIHRLRAKFQNDDEFSVRIIADTLNGRSQ
jgi:CheY-like chemotaxis protein